MAIIAALLVTLYFARRQIQALGVDLETRVLNDLDEKFHRIGEIFISGRSWSKRSTRPLRRPVPMCRLRTTS